MKRPYTVLFDYGGVLAEEGFRNTFLQLAEEEGLDPERVAAAAMDAVYESGYVVGKGSEGAFWDNLQQRVPLPKGRDHYRGEILEGFVLRPAVMGIVNTLRHAGVSVAILSDQTDWLKQLDRRDHFLNAFDHVFNSYEVGKGKRDRSIFTDVARMVGRAPEEMLFIDDNGGHIERARSAGLQAILYLTCDQVADTLERITGVPLSCGHTP